MNFCARTQEGKRLVSEIIAVYSDGGLVIRNPSPYGGAWAWCGVNEENLIVESKSGLLVPEKLGIAEISNNTAEFCAMARALRAMPKGWSGTAYSDSELTLNRIFGNWDAGKGLPEGWMKAARKNLKRLGKITPVLLSGHPTRQELLNGVCKRRGRQVSGFNVWCDEECRRICKDRAKDCLQALHPQKGR